jgi:CxxC motif-containing protein (DUF1111 family)
VRPFFHDGRTVSIREFVIGALNDEMGFQGHDPELTQICANGGQMTTIGGMTLDSWVDKLETPPLADAAPVPPGALPRNQLSIAIVDYLEFYLLNYFKPAVHEETQRVRSGRDLFERIGCTSCHVPDLEIRRDRRVADVETVFDARRGGMNRLFATAVPKFVEEKDQSGHPSIKRPAGQSFLVKNIYTDFKRHDLGPAFHERNYDGSVRTHFMTTPLWGVGSTAPYGHDGRSINLYEVILRHGGEAERQRDLFASLPSPRSSDILDFLNSLVLFPPDDTASNLDPGDPRAANYPLSGHGAIRLSVLFNDPRDPE